MQLSSLTEREQEIYDTFVEEHEEVYDEFQECEEGSETHREAMVISKVLSRVLREQDLQNDGEE